MSVVRESCASSARARCRPPAPRATRRALRCWPPVPTGRTAAAAPSPPTTTPRPAACDGRAARLAPPWRTRSRRRSRLGLHGWIGKGEADESLLEVVVAGTPAQLADAAFGHCLPTRHHDHVVAQPLHLLHDVGAEDDALAV